MPRMIRLTPNSYYELWEDTKRSLGRKMSPELAWLQIRNLVAQALIEFEEESKRLADKYQLPEGTDLTDLQEGLEYMDPVRGCNLLVYSSPKYRLANVLKAHPLKTLEAAIRIVTVNDQFQCSVKPKPY